MKHQCYLGLGSNLGDRIENLRNAIKLLQNGSIDIIKCSNLYETDPRYITEQPSFLNIVLDIITEYSPLELLYHVQNIENIMLRVREIKFGPRNIDIDILTYDDVQITSPELTIPHPLMFERNFVLTPLLDVLPSETLYGKNIQKLQISYCDQAVRLFSSPEILV